MKPSTVNTEYARITREGAHCTLRFRFCHGGGHHAAFTLLFLTLLILCLGPVTALRKLCETVLSRAALHTAIARHPRTRVSDGWCMVHGWWWCGSPFCRAVRDTGGELETIVLRSNRPGPATTCETNCDERSRLSRDSHPVSRRVSVRDQNYQHRNCVR